MPRRSQSQSTESSSSSCTALSYVDDDYDWCQASLSICGNLKSRPWAGKYHPDEYPPHEYPELYPELYQDKDVDEDMDTFSDESEDAGSTDADEDMLTDESESRGPATSESDESEESEGSDMEPEEICEPWPYTFSLNDNVWVCSHGKWYHGRVCSKPKKGQTKQGEGMFYWAIYFPGCKAKKQFAPLNGEIKPDTPYVRELLREVGVDPSGHKRMEN